MTRATCVENQANVQTVMSPSPDVSGSSSHSSSATLVSGSGNVDSQGTNSNLGNQCSWSEVVKKTSTHPTMTSAAKGAISSRTMSTSLDVKKIMADAAERAANIIIQDMRKDVSLTRAT